MTQIAGAATADLVVKVPPSTGDARQRDKLLMLGATLARMSVGLLTFIILARFLGPESFGVIATAVAYTTFLAMVSDYGLGVSALREASALPAQAGTILREALLLKACVALPLVLVGALIAVTVVQAVWIPIYALALAGTLAYSFADLALVTVRACRRFDIEAKVVIAGSLMMLIVLGGVVAFTHDLLSAAFAFAGTRLLYAMLAAVVLRRRIARRSNCNQLTKRLYNRLKRSTSYAIDAVLTNASAQIDLLLFGAILSAHTIGLYQAGARVVQVIMPLAAVLSTVYLPVLAAAAAKGEVETFNRNALKLNYEFAGLAIVSGIGFAFFGPMLAPMLFGSSYAPLNLLWAGFGVFALLRFMAAAYGIQLAALGRITPRIISQISAIITMVVLATIFLPRYGLHITSWVLAASSVPSLIVLAMALWRERRSTMSLFLSLMLVGGVTIFIVLAGW